MKKNKFDLVVKDGFAMISYPNYDISKLLKNDKYIDDKWRACLDGIDKDKPLFIATPSGLVLRADMVDENNIAVSLCNAHEKKPYLILYVILDARKNTLLKASTDVEKIVLERLLDGKEKTVVIIPINKELERYEECYQFSIHLGAELLRKLDNISMPLSKQK